MQLKKSFVILVIVLILLFIVPIVLNRWVSVIPIDNLVQAAQLAIALVGIFLGAHYELKNLKLSLKEERKKEIRQQKLSTLTYIESWLNDVSSSIENITVLRELSEKDETDGALIIPSGKLKLIEEELLRLETRGYIVLSKLAEVGNEELSKKVALVWVIIETPRKSLTKGIVAGTQPVITSIAEAVRALDKARVVELEQE